MGVMWGGIGPGSYSLWVTREEIACQLCKSHLKFHFKWHYRIQNIPHLCLHT